jgi:hypothetical protein
MSTTATRNPIELRDAGLKALNAALGPDDAQMFLEQYHGRYRGRGDFTKERHEQPEPSDEEIVAGIKRLEEEQADIIAATNAAWQKKMAAAS